jgi:predicted small lipoprotein YifL
MKQILLIIAVVALVGCGKKEPVQPSMPNPEVTQTTTPNPEATKPEPTKAKATAGVKLWEFETGRAVSSPAIGSDGTVYVGSGDNKLYAINGKSGVKLWEFKTGDDIMYSSPAIGSDGTVYVGSEDNKLYAIKTDSKGLAKSPWPMRGQNAQHTGRAPKKK